MKVRKYAQLDTLPGSLWRHTLRPSPHCIPTETSCLCHTDTTQVLAGGYRYGFNGMEREQEWGGDSYDFGARIYDARIGRWLSVDPQGNSMPGYSTYSYAYNNPITVKDPDGERGFVTVSGSGTESDPYILTINAHYLIEKNLDKTSIDGFLAGMDYLNSYDPKSYTKEMNGKYYQLNFMLTNELVENPSSMADNYTKIVKVTKYMDTHGDGVQRRYSYTVTGFYANEVKAGDLGEEFLGQAGVSDIIINSSLLFKLYKNDMKAIMKTGAHEIIHNLGFLTHTTIPDGLMNEKIGNIGNMNLENLVIDKFIESITTSPENENMLNTEPEKLKDNE